MCKYQKQCLAEAKTEQAAKNNSIDKLILYSQLFVPIVFIA